MIVRLVKMTFRPGEEERFQALFDGWRHRIIAMPGCRTLELLRDIKHPAVFFTRSVWDTEEALDNYRRSATFSEVWPVVKALFAARAEAWSLHTGHLMHASDT
ncbi:MAG: antibiotic biosynthesis monooxygenase [Bacteroidetes bacterium]|nr:antibiotic biosynthesis monooxygenase [Bacteroidota bacterium]MBS1943753.1 antibiotic biosynthesis monooxygenase [Bacteroidota bacterium]